MELTETLDKKNNPFVCGYGSDWDTWTEAFIRIDKLSAAISVNVVFVFVDVTIIFVLLYMVLLSPPHVYRAWFFTIN